MTDDVKDVQNSKISQGDKVKCCIKVQHIHLHMKMTSSNNGGDTASSYFSPTFSTKIKLSLYIFFICCSLGFFFFFYLHY